MDKLKNYTTAISATRTVGEIHFRLMQEQRVTVCKEIYDAEN